jgi:hypothetical protein
MVAPPVGFDRLTRKVSSGSVAGSSIVGTTTALVVTPGSKTSVPVVET